MSEEDREEETTAAVSVGADTQQLETQVDTLTRSQQRRAARVKKSSKKEKRERKSSRAETAILEDDDEVVEEEFDENVAQLGENKTSSVRTKSKVSTPDRTGFVPPTRVSGTQSNGKTKYVDGKAMDSRSSGYVPPARVSGPRPSKRSDGKKRGFNAGGNTSTEYVPPTQVASPRSSRKSADGKAQPNDSRTKPNDGKDNSVSSSGFVPPTHMSGPRPADKGLSMAMPVGESANHSATSSSGYGPPTHVKGPRPTGKGASMAKPIEENVNQVTSSGYIPPTQVSGPRSADKAISEKNTKTTEGKKASTTSSSGFVPPTRVSGPRSADKGIDGKANPARKGLSRGKIKSKAHQSPSGGSNPDLEAGDDAAAPPSTSAPPVSRSVDILPGVFTYGQPSNIEMDGSTQVPDHSESRSHARRMMGPDDESLHTAATMTTARIGNKTAVRFASKSSESQVSSARLHGRTHRPNRRVASGVQVDQRPMSIMMDPQGHTMSNEELRAVWERSGKCIECGIVQTHKKEKHGPFGALRRMKPITVEGQCYEGYCLRCHDVHDLRRLLNDYSIPLDLARPDPADHSMTSLQARDEEVMELAGKRSPIVKLCSSVKFQIFMGVTLVGIVCAVVGLGITLSKGPEPWVPPPPTSAPSEAPSTSSPTVSPTSYEWNVVSEFRRDYVDSFGHRVELSSDGQTLVVASPQHASSRGRLDVYRDLGSGTEWAEIGDAVVGGELGDELGFSVSLSDDGSAIAVASPGRNDGLVQVFFVDEKLGLVPKGQIILGPTTSLSSQFGYSIALNYAGDRLFVSAPQFALNVEEVHGMVQAFDFDGLQWVQVGSDIIGPNHGSRFGHSISIDDPGMRVVVGAPLDDERWEGAGQVHWYGLRDDEWLELPINKVLYGAEEQSNLGTVVRMDSLGKILAAGTRDSYLEEFENAGIVSFWGLNEWLQVDMVGIPVPGTHENATFGYDMDMSSSGEVVVVSGENRLENAGSVSVLLFRKGKYVTIGRELFGPTLGEKDWFGSGPSVAMAARYLRVAVGYENIHGDDGVSHPTVRIYDYYAAADFSDVSS